MQRQSPKVFHHSGLVFIGGQWGLTLPLHSHIVLVGNFAHSIGGSKDEKFLVTS